MAINVVAGVGNLEESMHFGLSGEDMEFRNRRIVLSEHVFSKQIQHQVVASTHRKHDAVVVGFRDGANTEGLDLQPAAPPPREH